MSEWRTHVGPEVVFRKCAVCDKSTEGLCHCDLAFCFRHMDKHLESCAVAKEA